MAESDKNNVSLATIGVPDECRVCMCCKDWSGSLMLALTEHLGIYGACDAHAKRTLSTASCDMFRASQRKVTEYQQHYKLLSVWKRKF